MTHDEPSDRGHDLAPTSWLPADFIHPTHVAVGSDHHLRPIRATDADMDLPAVMGSRDRLWATYGGPWGWPPAEMSLEQDREDLAHHEDEIERHLSFNYALLDQRESQLLGCVYIEPATKLGHDAEVSWWVVDDAVDTPLEAALDATVPAWLREQWPFTRPALLGVEITWPVYLTLPEA